MKTLNVLLAVSTAATPLATVSLPVFAEESKETAELDKEISALQTQIQTIYEKVNNEFLDLTKEEIGNLALLIPEKAKSVKEIEDQAKEIIERLEPRYKDIEEDLSAKRKAVKDAETVVAEKQTFVDTANEDLEPLKADLESLQNELTKIDSELNKLDQYKDSKDSLTADIETLKSEIAELETNQTKGVYGFLEYVKENSTNADYQTAAEKALEILNDTNGEKADGTGDHPENFVVKSELDTDSASEVNLNKLVELVEAVNDKRVNDDLFSGRSEYQISLPLIATALKSSQMIADTGEMEHYGLYDIVESISSTNDIQATIDLWYSEKEKVQAYYEEHKDTFSEETVRAALDYKEIGHYLSIVSGNYNCIGTAVGSNNSVLNTSSDLKYTAGHMTVEEFKEHLKGYLAYKGTLKEKQENLAVKEDLLAKLDNYDNAVADLNAEKESVNAQIELKTEEIENHNNTITAHQRALDAANESLDTVREVLSVFMETNGDLVLEYENAVDTLLTEENKETDLLYFTDAIASGDMSVMAYLDLEDLIADYENDSEMLNIKTLFEELQEVAKNKVNEYETNIEPLQKALEKYENELAEKGMKPDDIKEVVLEEDTSKKESGTDKAKGTSTGVTVGNIVAPSMIAVAGLGAALVFKKKK